MAETRFVKVVAFGGYDRADVIKKLEFLNSQIFSLKNELRETKLLMEEYKKGTDEEKAHETVMAGERAKLTSLQVQNETLSNKNKTLEEENQNLNKEIEALRNSVSNLNEKLAESSTKLEAIKAGDDAVALGAIFIKAQESATDLTNNAKKKAQDIENKSRQVAEEVIEEANDTAKRIIYEAEKNAAEIKADSINKAEEMKVSSNNMRVKMLDEVKVLKGEVEKIVGVFEQFKEVGLEKAQQSINLLNNTENKLTSGGVPVFKNPVTVEPELPEPPAARKLKQSKEAGEKLAKLQQMADSAAGKKKKNLADIARQAESLGGNKNEKSSDDKKSGKKKIDLADLAKKAGSL